MKRTARDLWNHLDTWAHQVVRFDASEEESGIRGYTPIPRTKLLTRSWRETVSWREDEFYGTTSHHEKN